MEMWDCVLSQLKHFIAKFINKAGSRKYKYQNIYKIGLVLVFREGMNPSCMNVKVPVMEFVRGSSVEEQSLATCALKACLCSSSCSITMS